MSVPPPSWMPKSTSTGSWRTAVRSTTSVLKATTEVRSDRHRRQRRAHARPRTPPDSAIEPDWSMAMTSSRWMAGASRPKPTRCSGTSVRALRAASGAGWPGWSRCQSMSPGAGPAGAQMAAQRAAHGLAGAAGPAGPRSRPTTVATTWRAVARASSGRYAWQGQEHPDEVDVGFERREHLRLEQEPGEVEPLDGVALHDLHHRASGSSGGCRPASAPPAASCGRARLPASAAGADRGAPS